MEATMVKSLVLFILSIVLLNGCEEKVEPYDFSDKEIKTILADIHTSEAALQSVFGKRKDSLRQVYMNDIYKIHHTDSLKIVRLLNKLREDPEKIEIVYQQLLEEMSSIPD
jgi:PBP1b-binding outer membrane lipoprotein LpoB